MITETRTVHRNMTALQVRDTLNLDVTPHTIETSDMRHVFNKGVMTTVRVTAERFAFVLDISDLGIVPTNDKRKDKVSGAINAVLNAKQRATLLPRDEMWCDVDGKQERIYPPEVTEQRIRALFPARFEGSDPKHAPDPIKASWYAVPMAGMTFVPFATWSRWYEQFQEAKQEHLAMGKRIVDNYDRLQKASIRHYSQIAIDVYTRLSKTAPEHLVRTERTEDGSVIQKPFTLLEWIRAWRRSVLRAWPTKEEIITKYTVEERFFWAPQPSAGPMINAEMIEYIQQMDNKDWSQNLQLKEEWERERKEIIESLWQDIQNAYSFIENEDERWTLLKIRTQVDRTNSHRNQELAVSYVRTIVERAEFVFTKFLEQAKNGGSRISPLQINMIMRVSQMIQDMTSGVSSLKNILEQAKQVEQYLEENREAIEAARSSSRNVRRATMDAVEDLPEILANALTVIRQEAESIVGHEARRTQFSEVDPLSILDDIRVTRAEGEARGRRGNGTTSGRVRAGIAIAPAPAIAYDSAGADDDMATVRRSR